MAIAGALATGTGDREREVRVVMSGNAAKVAVSCMHFCCDSKSQIT